MRASACDAWQSLVDHISESAMLWSELKLAVLSLSAISSCGGSKMRCCACVHIGSALLYHLMSDLRYKLQHCHAKRSCGHD